MSPATAWLLVLALAAGGLGIVVTNFGPLITQVGVGRVQGWRVPATSTGCWRDLAAASSC